MEFTYMGIRYKIVPNQNHKTRVWRQFPGQPWEIKQLPDQVPSIANMILVGMLPPSAITI